MRARVGVVTSVLPARAGIVPLGALAGAHIGCPPRPRGDRPHRAPEMVGRRRSSPPARGSSNTRGAGRHPGPVLPARAGIVLHASDLLHRLLGPPRPRGDRPAISAPTRSRYRSSPPARGSSGRAWRRPAYRPVLPARAGIVRCSGSPDSGPPRPPRPRGDCPRLSQGVLAFDGSSPPARGSSRDSARAAANDAVLPARAGIVRSAGTPRSLRIGPPRPRGDRPARWAAVSIDGESSPPARGSSSRPGPPDAPRRVLPARAGIVPSQPGQSGSPNRPPRPRGDRPRGRARAAISVASSPPARGSSPVDGPDMVPVRVLPARAGIVLRCRTSRRS